MLTIERSTLAPFPSLLPFFDGLWRFSTATHTPESWRLFKASALRLVSLAVSLWAIGYFQISLPIAYLAAFGASPAILTLYVGSVLTIKGATLVTGAIASAYLTQALWASLYLGLGLALLQIDPQSFPRGLIDRYIYDLSS